jgi:O-antigen/teichoic acid export membrane protein
MTPDALIHIVALCVVLACAETLHGIARIKLLIPRLGKERAIKLSALTGTLLAFVLCWLLVPGIGLQGAGGHAALGPVLAVFMASFDIAIGKWLMHKPWHKIRPDFDPRTGNYLLFGLIALCGIPLAVWALRGAA